MKKISILIVSLVLAFILSLSSCKKKVEQPVLPPSQTMELNDSDFQSNNLKEATAVNWLSASITVGVWSTIVKVSFALPIIAYEHALDQTPQRVDNSTWLWQYDVPVAGVNHTVKLYGSVDPNEDMVSWEMYVDDFNWFVGENNIATTEGYWIFYSPDDKKEKLRVEWTYNYSDSTGTTKFIIIDQDADNYNSYLYYGNNLTGLYNCFFNIINTTDTTSVEIQWHNQTKIGRIKSVKYFGDEAWHCWDENLQDCQCPTSN